MINKSLLKEYLIPYKQNFVSQQWPSEKYKWEAIKWFQDNWDVNAEDFAEMLTRSLSQTGNLLASTYNFPKDMIIKFAESAPDEVRSMFIALFDEKSDVYERIKAFKMKSADLLEKYGDGAKNHFQAENSISTYLWLRYPDKYYIYKYGEAMKVADVLENDYRFKRGAYAKNIRNFYKFYDAICDELKQDSELVTLLQSQLTDTCYPDPELKTLTIDVGFYISRNDTKNNQIDTVPNSAVPEDVWLPKDYDPGLSVEDWVELLNDEQVFNTGSLEVMKRMKDYGGMATCVQLADKYGKGYGFYNSSSSNLAIRIAKKTGCPVAKEKDGSPSWWPILYVGRHAGKDEKGSYVWKLRDELAEALELVDLSDIEQYANSELVEVEPAYWWLNANPKICDLSDLAADDNGFYPLYTENGNPRKIFQNFRDV